MLASAHRLNTPPPVSVVMPSLNQAAFLAAAVHSIFEQGVEGLELVVVDGGSTDGSLSELAALAGRYPGQIRWCSQPDDGPAQAVNRAIGWARGAVIGWLNSDDLYAPGAVQRALQHLSQSPEDVMVYGEAEHVDGTGLRLEAYPTRSPSTPLQAYADGCHICQPSVFFRRDAFVALGGLDGSLRAAFDFDLWLRFFKAYPGRIGFVPALQARSRLHAGSITMRLRERVALEGMQVVHRHLGVAPGHWLLTHVGELLAAHPFHAGSKDLATEVQRLLNAGEPWMGAEAAVELRQRVQGDRRLQLASPHFCATVHADGWAGATLDLRLRQPELPVRGIELVGRHAAPGGRPLRLRALAPDGGLQTAEVDPGPFTWQLALAEQRPGAQLVYRVSCPDTFVPAQWEAGSQDQRTLAFLLDECRLVAASEA